MRPEKAGVVSELQERISDSQFCLLVDYTGMHVPHFEEVRKRLRATGAKMRVVKNTHFEKAAEKLNLGDVSQYLAGQCALVIGGDVAASVKVLNSFVKEFSKPKLRAGVLEGKVINGEEAIKLADLPSKEQVQSKLLGLLLQPVQRMANLASEPPTMLVRVLQAKADKDKAEG